MPAMSTPRRRPSSPSCFVLLLASLFVACNGPASDPGPEIKPPDALGEDLGLSDLAALPDLGPRADTFTSTGPEIDPRPATLTLPAAAGQVSEPVPLVLHNAGTSPLLISAISLDGQAGEHFVLVDAPEALPVEVAPGEALTVHVTYEARVEGTVEGTLTVTSNDADEERLVVRLTGRTARSCLRATPPSIDVGTVQPGSATGRFGVTLNNCGDRPLNLVDVRVMGDMGFRFESQNVREPLVGGSLPPGGLRPVDVWYVNEGLADGMSSTGQLLVQTDDAEAPLLIVELRVRAQRPDGCAVAILPDRIDFGYLRIGLSLALPVEVVATGTRPCELRTIDVEVLDGPPENVPTVTRPPASMILEPGQRETFELTYAPLAIAPAGDRGELHVNYRDPETGQNLRATAFVFGVGSESLIDADRGAIDFPDVTVPGCGSFEHHARAVNVGSVPFCVNDYRLDGEGCASFLVVDSPTRGQCTNLESRDTAEYAVHFEPSMVGAQPCTLVVLSDAMNRPELPIPLHGAGVDSAESSDRHEVGDLDGGRRAYFGLSRPAIEDSIAVRVGNQDRDDFGFDRDGNRIYFERGDHPARGAIVEITYEARCLPLLGL